MITVEGLCCRKAYLFMTIFIGIFCNIFAPSLYSYYIDITRNLKAPVLKVDSDVDEILHFNRLLLSIVGIWPLKLNASYLTRTFSLIRIIATCISCSVMMVLQFITLYIHWGDIGVMSEIGCMFLSLTMVFLTYLYVVLRRSDFYIVYELICEFWRMARNQEERNNIVELANHSRISTTVYFYAVFVQVPVTICGPALVTLYNYVTANGTDYNRRLPNDLYYGRYCQISPNYEILFTVQSLASFFGASAAAGVNSTTMAIVMHIAGQFRLVSLRLKAIGQSISDRGEFENKTGNNLTKEIQLWIKHHDRVLRVSDYVNVLLGPVIFGVFIVAGIEICFTGWAVMKSDNNLANTFKFAGLFMITCLQLFLWCWSSEAIIQESCNIGHVAFSNVPWSILPCSLQRDLTFIICRSQKQSQLDAMRLQVMCMRKLTEVFNTAMSYMALLRSMKEK